MTTKAQAKKLLLRDLATIIANNDDLFPETVPLELESRECLGQGAVAPDECPQGQFLRHELDNGFTAVQWWDRCQGDTRGGCNSTILLEGRHTSVEVLAAGREHFPSVFENLARGGPPLPRHLPNPYWKPPENQGCIELVEVLVP